MRHTFYEIVEKAVSLPRKEAIAWLQQNDTKPLRQILRFIYDPKLEIMLPNSMPPLKVNPTPEEELMFVIFNEARRLRIFIKGGGYDGLNQMKREALFCEILDNVHIKDAELLGHGQTRKPIKGLTEKMLLEAFPDLFQTPYA